MNKISRHRGIQTALVFFGLLFSPAGHAQTNFCLTGNAPAAETNANIALKGRYTYYDGGTFSFSFPHPVVGSKAGRPIDEPNRNGGWVPFREGVLTDGKTDTRVGWPSYWVSHRSMDVYFDLGQECFIDEVEVLAGDGTIRNLSLWLKSPGEERETMVRTVTDRATFATNHYPKLESPCRIKGINASAQWLRVNGCWKGASYEGWSEIRIWGRPMQKGETRPPKVAAAQREGKFLVAKPQPLPLEQAPDRAIFPIPCEFSREKGAFTLTPKTRILVATDASPQTERSARVFAEDLKETAKLDLKVERSNEAQDDSIVIATAVKAGLRQSYSICVEPPRVAVSGGDEQGTFYGTQGLLQLIGMNDQRQWDIPACVVRDQPRNPIRYVSGSEPLSESLIRALARFKINYYGTPEEGVPLAIQHRQFAEDRFVKIVPAVGFEGSFSQNPELLVERAPSEKLSDLGTGRRNPCPSQPLVWSNFFARIDRAAACNGEYIKVGMDEMYQPANGARWNVCDLCRARKLKGHELMADTIQKIHDYLKTKGKKVMIIDSPFAFQGISHPDDKENDWREIVPMLPNDMLVYIWHPKEILEPLHQAGYPLLRWGCSAFKDETPDEYLGQYLNLNDGPFYIEQLMAMSQLCWSPEQALPATSKCTAHVESAMPAFRQLFTGDKVPSRQPGAEFFTVDLKGVANTSLVDDAPGDGKGFADLGGNYDLRSLPPGPQTLARVPFQILDRGVMVNNRLVMNKRFPERLEIPLDQKAASLIFLHTLDDRPGQNYIIRKELCGYYFMVYEDGKYDKLEIKYNINIANFDGMKTWWDYSPNSESLKRATLAWKGQMGSGNEAVLYHAEWVNPRPDVKISKVIFASPHIPMPSSPVLLALTGVRPDGKNGNSSPTVAPLRDAALIAPAKPVGIPIDLSDGVNESDRRWRTRDGIVVECNETLANPDKTGGCEPFWARASSAVFDNLEWTRCETASGIEVKVTLPQPRKLAGISLTGSYRDEACANDFPPSMLDYTVEASADGSNWYPVTKEKVVGYIPEEEGAKYHSLDNQPIKAVRIHVWRNNENKASQQYERGISFLQLFAAE
ncbi:MAG: discoidin domain-containing protein [Verrucomicrobia bacterium]|nr:discoidin domain-containing protein [Verrucomicrobiota bacterium]